MISLILTSLLGLFCCSSVNINALDQTKEIEVRENVSKNAIQNGNFYAYSFTDIYTEDGLKGFISYMNTTYDTNVWSYDYNGSSNNQLLSEVDIPLTGVEFYSTGSKDTNTGLNVSLGVCSYVKCKVYYYIRGVTQDYDHRYEMKFYNSDNLIYTEIRWYLFHDRATSDINDTITWAQSWYYPTAGNTNTSTKNPDIFFTTPTTDTLGLMFGNIVNIWDTAYQSGFDYGYELGKQNGQQIGYGQAISDLSNTQSTALTIFTGFVEVGLLPVNVFLQILNFEVFGINIGGFVSALLTVSIVIIVIRFLLGGKSDD